MFQSQEEKTGQKNMVRGEVVKFSPKLGNKTNLQIQETPQIPFRRITKKTVPKHIIIQLMKTKDKQTP